MYLVTTDYDRRRLFSSAVNMAEVFEFVCVCSPTLFHLGVPSPSYPLTLSVGVAWEPDVTHGNHCYDC